MSPILALILSTEFGFLDIFLPLILCQNHRDGEKQIQLGGCWMISIDAESG